MPTDCVSCKQKAMFNYKAQWLTVNVLDLMSLLDKKTLI